MAYRFCGEGAGDNELRLINRLLNINAFYDYF